MSTSNQVDTKIAETVPLQTLLQLIPDFDTSQATQVYRYIRSCDSAFKLSSIPQQEILLIYVLNKITGPYSSDVHAKQHKNWCELKQFLIQKFSQTKTLAHLHIELQSMFQRNTETVTEYLHRVDLCRNKILEKLTAEVLDDSLSGRKITTEETALSVFVNGLNSDIGTMLRTKEFTNLSDAGNFAMQEDKIRKMNSARQGLNSINKQTTFIANRPTLNRTPLTQPQKTCNYCKKPGHVISECRKRAFNNSLRTPHNHNTTPQTTLPTPSHHNTRHIQRNVNHLNSQAAMETGIYMETASADFLDAQTPTSTPISNSNSTIRTHGTSNISLDRFPSHKFHVADINIAADGILGNDFMSKFNVNIYVQSKSMRVRDTSYKLFFLGEEPKNVTNKQFIPKRSETVDKLIRREHLNREECESLDKIISNYNDIFYTEDDIVVFASSLQEHEQKLTEVFDRLRQYGLKVQPDKCEFLRKEQHHKASNKPSKKGRPFHLG
ncbi:hypothetical protein ABMA27_006229 [Loxostege sticticalis]|uniref:CCHC-type domain-containing protein n=1 Tax=Loxostege sticticalis TaxID=481309 RepID=A0ABR3HI17_LOXSC